MRTEVSVPKLFAVVLILLLFAVGCGGGGSSTTATPPNPTLNLIASPTSVASGSSATLVWSSSNATSCTASGGWSGSKTTSGSASTGAVTSATTTFTLTCSGASGTTAIAESVHVTVVVPNPTVSLRANPTSVTSGSSATLTWSSSNATSCALSGGSFSSTSEATSGSASTGVLSATTIYTITCSGTSGTRPAVASATVTVTAPSLTCVAEAATLAEQLQNPVALFATDNNGVILELPTVGGSGAATVSGSLVIGIGTRSGNGLNGATRLNGDPATGDVTAALTGDASISNGYLDSGSNAFFFPDSALNACGNQAQGFYCPPSTVNETATLMGTNSLSLAADFSVANAVDLFANTNFTAFNDLGGSVSDLGGLLDLGLPFFFGRNVFMGMEPANGATAPYFAYGGTQSIATTGPPNVEPLIVDGGPSGLPTRAVNVPFISVRICVPGTTTCQTIDHVVVDTGSVGLRLMASVVTISLPALTDLSSRPLAECLQFASGTTWGSVATADLTLPISGESARGVNVQLIGASSVGSPPSGCAGMAINTVETFGANGIIGVGPFVNDCNATGECEPAVQSANYYYCTG